QRLAFGEDALDRLRRLAADRLSMLPDVGDVEEGGALEADLEERGLHAGKHPRDAPHVDVPDQAAARAALDQELLHHPRACDRYACFLRGDINKNFFGHAVYRGAGWSRRAAAP